MQYKLTYILTTFNKLEYLKHTLPALIEGCKEDEEIVVLDGGSTDGSAIYIQQFFEKGKIHQFKSEKDFGEAHGYNKAMLLSRGELIKIISDDDVYDYEAVAICRKYMLENTSIDLLYTEGLAINLALNQTELKQSVNFDDYKKTGKMFFTGLSIMMRKSSLPLLGLFNTGYIIVDLEYAYRIQHTKASIYLYTGYSYANVINPASNSFKSWIRLLKEKEELEVLYGFLNRHTNYVQWMIWRSKFIACIKQAFKIKVKENKSQISYANAYVLAYEKLKVLNKQEGLFHKIK